MASKNLKSTPTQVLGPYFLEDAPLQTVLDLRADRTGKSGITVKGQVLAPNGDSVSNALVHVWLADANGRYDNQDASGRKIDIDAAQYKLRGCVQADSQGAYSFKCDRPGNYALDEQKTTWRPAHIHIRVSAPDFKTLVTQLYFKDDQYNEHDLDGEEFFKPELIVPLTPEQAAAGTMQEGKFDFVLRVATRRMPRGK